MLHGQVPLLHVAGTSLAVGSVNALAEPGIRRERNGREGWALRENERGPQIVLRFLLHILDERELRRREWSCNARLVDEDDTESRADYRLWREQVSKSDTRSKIAVVQF